MRALNLGVSQISLKQSVRGADADAVCGGRTRGSDTGPRLAWDASRDPFNALSAPGRNGTFRKHRRAFTGHIVLEAVYNFSYTLVLKQK